MEKDTVEAGAGGGSDQDEVESVGEKDALSPESRPLQPTARRAREHIINVLCVLLNTVSTVALVFVNKIIFDDVQLRKMQMSFATWHFTCTALVLWVACHRPFHLFEPVRLPVIRMLPLCCFFAGFLVLNNLSLAYNSVGFYQLAKIMTTPTVVLLNFLLSGITITVMRAVSLIAVCCGVALVNGASAGSNLTGAAIAALAFTVTALYQVWIGKKIQDFKVSSSQLLMNQAPIGALLLALLVPFLDTVADLRTVPASTLVALFFSGLTASILNLSQFLIIGRMSALTFNVTSNLKTVIIVSLGWFHEGKILLVQDVVGVLLAIGGVAYYTHLSRT
ncbi:MAG: hypothetical protein M1837_001113 [Sclerophora amabilis]|nr:MAG: hypothetical protein M1837_001113 [Sclerophora amabilis]